LTTPSFTPEAIVIGASAGAIEALSAILPALPADYPLPLLIVVHLPPDTKSALPDIFAAKCRIEIKEAEDKETIRPGVVYFAPPNYHLLVESNRILSLSSDEPELYSRPSINVLFESAADAYGSGLLGVILTGGSSDGAHGLQAVSDAGGMTIAQDPQTAEVRAMPAAALEACLGARPMKLNEIAVMLSQLPYNASPHAR
jgi:two-component system chemotaxis response regulator CheB